MPIYKANLYRRQGAACELVCPVFGEADHPGGFEKYIINNLWHQSPAWSPELHDLAQLDEDGSWLEVKPEPIVNFQQQAAVSATVQASLVQLLIDWLTAAGGKVNRSGDQLVADLPRNFSLETVLVKAQAYDTIRDIWMLGEVGSYQRGEGLFGWLCDQGFIEQIERIICQTRLGYINPADRPECQAGGHRVEKRGGPPVGYDV